MGIRGLALVGLVAGCTPFLDLEGPAAADADPADFAELFDAYRPLDGATPDAAVPTPADVSVPDARPPADARPLPDARPAPDAAGPPDGGRACVPGERLDLCIGCDADGAVVALADDDACPSPCEPVHALRDGACFRQDAAPVTRCRGPGLCEEDPAFACALSEPTLVVAPGECERVADCVGAEPPTLVPAEAGTPCDAGGRCIDGACEAAGPCDFSPAVVVCDPGVMFGDELCVVRPVDPGLTTCAAVCELGGAECVSATQTLPGLDACLGGVPHGCFDLLSTPACGCRLPG
ncbi:MAG: hypothetical protein R3F60_13215 [bacterium]